MIRWSEKYEKVKKIGQGSSGQIFLVLRRDLNELMAVKIIKAYSDQAQLNAIELQIKIMTSCNHPNLVKCYGVQLFQGQVWILMEYCQQGSLSDIMRLRRSAYSQQEISQIMSQILQGLDYMHKKSIIHRDIKASNLLYHRGSVKIADFGISVISQGNTVQPKFTRIGSPFWMSPEILSQSIYNSKSDVWALGITAIQLAEGEPPYSHQHPFRAIYSIQTHPPQGLKKAQLWSKQFNQFVKLCLTLDHKERPSASELLDHEFINKKVVFSSNESSPSNIIVEQQQNAEDTMILHDYLPQSVWQKGSFPQTEEKIMRQPQQMYDTVIVKQNTQQSLLLFSDLKQHPNGTSQLVLQNKNKENLNHNIQTTINIEQRQKKVKQLYKSMEDQIKSIRRKYMKKISQLYVVKVNENENKQWNSPIKKLKQKNNNMLNNEHYRSTSQMFKKML